MASYDAVSAKVHALYGGRFTGEDYQQLLSRKTVSEAAAFLRSHRGYRSAMTGLGAASAHREALESALWGVYVDEYRRIFSFMGLGDKELLRFPQYRAEQSAILAAMRLLTSASSLAHVGTWDALLMRQSRLDLSALESANSFSDIVHAAENTIFGDPLRRILVGESKTPSAAFVDNIMQVAYYAKLYKVLSKNYTGQTKQIIKQSLDEETDLLNIVQFLRLKKHFSDEDVQRYSFPLPASGKLRREYIRQLIATDSYDAAYQLVLDGPFGPLFRSVQSQGLEAYYYTLQWSFSRRQLRSAKPTVYTPIAYLTLKEIEVRNIISIVESIRYGVDPHDYVTLVGVT